MWFWNRTAPYGCTVTKFDANTATLLQAESELVTPNTIEIVNTPKSITLLRRHYCDTANAAAANDNSFSEKFFPPHNSVSTKLGR